jgi:tetratricopeptide (TPR) repeat protein
MAVESKKKRKSTPKSSRKSSSSKIEKEILSLQESANQAWEEFDYSAAIEAYSQALDQLQSEDQPTEIQYNLLSGRAKCFRRLGDLHNEKADLEQMVALAKKMKDESLELSASARMVQALSDLGEVDQSEELAEEIVAQARSIGDKGSEAESLHQLGINHWFFNRPELAEEIAGP